MNDFSDWQAGGIINPEPQDPRRLPALLILAGVQLVHQFLAVTEDKERRERIRAALHLMKGTAADAIAKMGEDAGDASLVKPLKRQVHKRIPEGACLGLLVTAVADNPFAPYMISIPATERRKALQLFAADLGVPKSWADEAEAAVKKANSGVKVNPWGILVAVLGVGLFVVAPPLATLLAPAGLAGGAAVLAGLAALGGSFGLMGGIAVIGSVAALGAGMGVLGVLTSGSVQEVEARVLLLHAMAIAKKNLRPGTPAAEGEVLRQMLEILEEELRTREKTDDSSSPAKKACREKIKKLNETLKRMAKEGLLS